MRTPLTGFRAAAAVVLAAAMATSASATDPKDVTSGDYIPVVQAVKQIRQQTEAVKLNNFQALQARADHWQGPGREAFVAQFKSGRLQQNSNRLIGEVRDKIITDLESRDPNSLVSVKEVQNYGPAFNTYTKAIRDALWNEAGDAGLKREDFPNDRAFQRAVQGKLGADDWKEVIAKIEPVHQQILANMADPHADPKLPGPVRLMDTNIQKQLDVSLSQAEQGDGHQPGHPENQPVPPAHTPSGGTAANPNSGVTPGAGGATQNAQNRLAFGDVDGANRVLAGAAESGKADAAGLTMLGGMALDEGRYGDAAGAARSALKLEPSNQEARGILAFSEGRIEGAGGGGPAGGEGRGFAGGAGGAGGASGSAGGRASYGGFVGRDAAAPTEAQRAAAARLSSEQAQKAAQNALSLRDYSMAMAYADRALASNPNDAGMLNIRATVYARQRDYAKGLADAKAAWALAPKNGTILRTKGFLEVRSGQYKDALGSANMLIESNPKDAYGYALRAQAEAHLGDLEGYRADMARAAELDPSFAKNAPASLAQAPSDSDLVFLFPGEEGPRAAAPSRARNFSWIVGASIVGGLLLAFGLLQTVLAPLKEQVASAFTRITRTGPTVGDLAEAPASRGPAAGLIRGQYEITRPIGAGGMGMVYEGTDRSLGRRVAIKKMRDELRADARERARFVSEAKTVAALHHPNIVDIYSIADEGDDVYLIFEYVDGKTVHDLVQAQGRLAPDQAAAIVDASAGALEFAHGRGVIHRDMKPSNVMVDASGRVKVMDFGIARMAKEALTRYSMTNTVVGTPPYMAPEQEQGQVRRESDVYSLAVCAYEMLTGRLPFQGIGGGMSLNKINMAFIPPSRETPGLPPALDGVFARAFQADPEKRYRTPAEFAAALRSALPAAARA